MLLGIIFVVHTSIGGDKLMFRYPAVTRGKVSDETMMAFRQQHPMMTPSSSNSSGGSMGGGGNNSRAISGSTGVGGNTISGSTGVGGGSSGGSGGTGGGSGNNPGGSGGDSDKQQADAKNSNLNSKDPYYIYNLSSEIITPILIPKPTLCNQSFELTIENTKFIGHPTLLENIDSDSDNDDDDNTDNNDNNNNNNSQDNKKQKGSTKKKKEHQSKLLRKKNVVKIDDQDEFNKTITISQHQNQQTNQKQGGLNNSSNSLSTSNQQVKTHGGKSLTSSTNSNDSSKSQSSDEITVFNCVFVLSSKVGEANPSRDSSLKRIALKIASALKHEQNRCNYIANQSHDMMTVRDQWLTEHTLETISEKPNHEELTNRMLNNSRLAREIKEIYQSLVSDRLTSLRINGWINLHLNISNPDVYSDYPIRPYHALLVFNGEDSIQLPPSDISPSLTRLLDVAKPTKNFRDLQMETDLPLSQIYRLASHLVYWRKAKIINMMTKNNVYILKSTSTLNSSRVGYKSTSSSSSSYSTLSLKFSQLFPDFKFQDILVRFSTSRPLSEHISKFHQQHHVAFLQIVGWLLQHDLIIQLHTYVHLMVMTPNNLISYHNSSSNTTGTQQQQQEGDHHSHNGTTSTNLYTRTAYPLMPSHLEGHEITFFEKIDDNTKSYQLFKRLCPYFRGLHHLEEIMWRENISREDLNKILKKYKNVLVQVTHSEGEDINKHG